jgi:hypothetical protein
MIEIRQKAERKFCNIGGLWYIFRKLLFAREVEVLIYFPDDMKEAYMSKKRAYKYKPIVGWQGKGRSQDICFRIFQEGNVLETCRTLEDNNKMHMNVREEKASASNDIPVKVYMMTRRAGEWLPILPLHPYPSNSFRYRVAIRRVK